MSQSDKYKWITQYKDLSDADLIEDYKETNDLAFVGALFYRYYDLIFGLSLKYLKSTAEAEDVCYEIFELLVVKVKVHDIHNFKPWLYRIATNYCLDKLRKTKAKKLTDIELHVSGNSINGFELIEANKSKELIMKRVEACMQKLVIDQRKCIDLFYFKEKSYKEISDELNISWTKTRSNIQNGKRNLKICLERL